MRSLLIATLLAASAGSCDENVVKQSPPVESNPQFVIEREMKYNGMTRIIVVRDKVNNRLVYITPEAGVYVERDDE